MRQSPFMPVAYFVPVFLEPQQSVRVGQGSNAFVQDVLIAAQLPVDPRLPGYVVNGRVKKEQRFD